MKIRAFAFALFALALVACGDDAPYYSDAGADAGTPDVLLCELPTVCECQWTQVNSRDVVLCFDGDCNPCNDLCEWSEGRPDEWGFGKRWSCEGDSTGCGGEAAWNICAF